MTEFEQFQKTDAEFSPVPFWFWNHKIEKDEITRQLNLMAREHIYECVIHARHGLITPYLSEEWFECIKHAICEGKRLGMRFWIYDENNWPSGYAGGKVLEANPDYNEKHIKMLSCKPGESPDLERVIKIIAVYEQNSSGKWLRNDSAGADKPRRIFAMYNTRWKVAYGEDYYIDLLNPSATKEFLQITHKEYLKRFSEDIGTVIRGFFSDEAGFYNGLQLPWSDRDDDGSLVWTYLLPDYFKECCGYEIYDELMYLFVWDEEHSPAIRRDFQNTVCKMYRESFLIPQREFSEAYNMKLIGHLHYEEYLHLHVATQGDFIKAISEFSYAGCDRIEYWPGSISERITSSVARQFEKPRVLSETFARGGWDFTMNDLHRWTDFQLVRGINLFVIHAFFYNIEGFRRDDAPPSYFFQSPAYPLFHYYSDYVMRMCRILTEGTPVNSLGVYYPTSSGQVLFDVLDREAVRSLDRDVQSVVLSLEEAQYDCCLLHESSIQNATYQSGGFVVGKEKINSLIILTRWLSFDVFESIYKMAKQGLPVAFLRHRPKCIETEKRALFENMLTEILKSDSAEYISEYYFYREFTYRFDVRCLNMVKGFQEAAKPVIALQTTDINIKCTARKIGDMTVYFIVNENNGVADNTFYFNENRTPVIWNANDGTKSQCGYTIKDNKAEIPLVLAPFSSLLVVFGDKTAVIEAGDTISTSLYTNGNWLITAGEKIFNSPPVAFDVDTVGKISKITYEYDINIDNPGSAVNLTVNKLNNACEVIINGVNNGAILWQPYSIRCSSFKKGLNHICLIVYTTPAVIMDEKALPFGIEGQITLDIIEGNL